MVVSRANLQLTIGHGLSRVLKFVGSVCREGLFVVSSVFGSDVGARHAKHRRQASAVAASGNNSNTKILDAVDTRARQQTTRSIPSKASHQTGKRLDSKARTTKLAKDRREGLTTAQVLARVRSQQAQASIQRQQVAY